MISESGGVRTRVANRWKQTEDYINNILTLKIETLLQVMKKLIILMSDRRLLLIISREQYKYFFRTQNHTIVIIIY